MVIFGLKNHAPEDFKEVTRQEHTGKDGGPIETQSLAPEQRAEQAVRLIDETFGAEWESPSPAGKRYSAV